MATISDGGFTLSKNDNMVMEIDGLPNVSFFLVNFSIPGLTMGTTPIPNPFLDAQAPGSKLNYEPLDVSMPLAEDMRNWIAIYEWMLEAIPSNLDPSNTINISNTGMTKRGGSIIVTTNNGNPIFSILLKNMFPISLSEVDIDIQQAEPVPPIFTVNFQYESYELLTI